MANNRVDHHIYKPTINLNQYYSNISNGGSFNGFLVDNRYNTDMSRTRYSNGFSALLSTNQIIVGSSSYTTSYPNRLYFQDNGYISKAYVNRAGNYLQQKLYYRIKSGSMTASSFLDTDVIYFGINVYNREYLRDDDDSVFFIESMDPSDFDSKLFDRSLYNNYYTVAKTFSDIKNLTYIEFDLKDYRSRYTTDPSDPLNYQDVNNIIFEISIHYIYRASTGQYIFLDYPINNLNTGSLNFHNEFSEADPVYKDGSYFKIGTSVGANKFYFEVYERQYNDYYGYVDYECCTSQDYFPLQSDLKPYEFKYNYVKPGSINSDGTINYSDATRIKPSAEALQKDASNNIKRIFWRFNLDSSGYYGRIVGGNLILYVSSIEESLSISRPLNYVIRACSLSASKYQTWTSDGVTNATLTEMYDESVLMYNSDATFGGNGEIDGALTYAKSPYCLLNTGYYHADIGGHPWRSVETGETEQDKRRRLGGLSAWQNYKYHDSNIDSITLIIEQISTQDYSFSYNKYTHPTPAEIYLGKSDIAANPYRKYISGINSLTDVQQPFLFLYSQYPVMQIKDNSGNEIPNPVIYNIDAGTSPTSYVFKIKNIGGGLLDPALSEHSDPNNIIASLVKTQNKDIRNVDEDYIEFTDAGTTCTEETVTVNFNSITYPGKYLATVKIYEANTVSDEQNKYVYFEVNVNSTNDLKVSTINPGAEPWNTPPAEISHTLNMECYYGENITDAYKLYLWNNDPLAVTNILYVVNNPYDPNIWLVADHPSTYRYAAYDLDYIHFPYPIGYNGRAGGVVPLTVAEQKIDVYSIDTIDFDLSNTQLLTNGDISTDNWPDKNDCTTTTGYRGTSSYGIRSADSYSSVTTPTFNLSKFKNYRIDILCGRSGTGFDYNLIDITLLDGSGNTLMDLTPNDLRSIGYSFLKFEFYATTDYNNCKIKFENRNTTIARTLRIESVSVKEAKILPVGDYKGTLEIWDYNNVDPNFNKILIDVNLTVKRRPGPQESGGIMIP